MTAVLCAAIVSFPASSSMAAEQSGKQVSEKAADQTGKQAADKDESRINR